MTAVSPAEAASAGTARRAFPMIMEYGAADPRAFGKTPGSPREVVDRMLLDCGAVVLRNFPIKDRDGFEALVQSLNAPGSWLDYSGERASPRQHVAGHTYSSTEYHPSGTIFVHNEMCNRTTWPLRLHFCCMQPAESGGATPVCDIRAVTRAVPQAVKNDFRARGIRYTRNFGGPYGVSLEYGFGTDDRAEIEQYCGSHGIAFEWMGDSHLRTSFGRPAFANHPITGEELWFNYATFYARSTLERRFQLVLRDTPDEDLAFSVRFGDGSEVPEEHFAACRAAYVSATARFDWQKGDVLVLDNMLAGHGRDSYKGDRTVWLAMTQEVGWNGFVGGECHDG